MKQVTLNCFSSLDEISCEDLKNQKQLLVINKVNDSCHEILNYTLNNILIDCIYSISVSGFTFKYDNLKHISKTLNLIKIKNKFYETLFSLYSFHSNIHVENIGFSQEKYSKTITNSLTFNINENHVINLTFSITFRKIIMLQKKINIYDGDKNKRILISNGDNLDIIFNYFLNLCEDKDAKNKFKYYIDLLNFNIKDYIEDNEKIKFNDIKKYLVNEHKIITNKCLNNLLNNSFQLNDNIKCYFPFYYENTVNFTFTNNDNIVQNYTPTEVEKKLLEFMKKYYLNYNNSYDIVINPFTKKISKPHFKIFYESETGVIISKYRDSYYNKYYLKYNNILYEENDADCLKELIDEYNIFKKLMN